MKNKSTTIAGAFDIKATSTDSAGSIVEVTDQLNDLYERIKDALDMK